MMRRALQLVALTALIALNLCCGGIGVTPEASVADVPSRGPVGKTIKANRDKFAICGRDSVSVQTGTSETLQLRFRIDGTGKVVKAWTESMTAPDPDLQSCVLHALKHIQFPAPKDGNPKEINYPLVLKPE